MVKLAVFHSTGAGSTRGLAEVIAEAAGADCLPVDARQGPEEYDAVILGAPIRFDRWLTPARTFAATHADTLSRMPVAGFFACLAAADADGRGARSVARYADRVAAQLPGIEARDVGRFAGALNFARLPLSLRLPVRLGMRLMRVPEADYRDMPVAARWGRATGARLRAELDAASIESERGVAAQ